MTNETRITSDPDIPTIHIVREFDAPAAHVFRAHVEPDLFTQWIGPTPDATVVDHFDARSGGAFRYVQTFDGEEYAFRGCFHDVVPSELIVQTFVYEGSPEGVALERHSFVELGDGRTRLTVASMSESFEARDAWISSGMEDGVNMGHANLDGVLAGL